MMTSLFVRCVGIGVGIYQKVNMRAYDYRLVCALDGCGEIYLDGICHELREGMIYIIKPTQHYRVTASQSQKIAVINFDGNYNYSHIKDPILSVDCELFDSELALYTELPFDLPGMPLFAQPKSMRVISEMYDIYMNCESDRSIRNLSLSSRLMYVISCAVENSKTSSRNRLSEAIYTYVLENATSNITLSDVANHFNYSESFISKTIRAKHSTSFKQLVIDVRLRKALWLLENTELSCDEISNTMGFCNTQHFSAAFKKRYGISPRKAR